jgi:ABC-2 type transport system permease protein
MPVYDRSYRRWDGELSRRALRFLPIAATGIRQAFTVRAGWFLKLQFWLLLIASLLPTLFFAFMQYVRNFQPTALRGMVTWLEKMDAFRTLEYPLLIWINTKFLMAFTVIIGSGLIARDRAAGAMPLYLSRPVTRLDYALGKFCVLSWFLMLFTVVPCLALWAFGVISSPDDGALRQMLPEVPRFVLHGLVVTVTYASTMLAVSSLCRRPMFAGLIWFALIILLPNFVSFAGTRLHWTVAPALSPNDAFEAIGFDIWNLDAMSSKSVAGFNLQGVLHMLKVFPDTPVEWCWISVAGWVGASLLLLARVLRREDVVTDAAR